MNVNPDQPESNFPNMSNLVSEVPPQAKYNPEGNVIDAGKATSWYGYGFDQFKANAGVWIGMVVVLFVIMLVLNVIPGIGTFIFNLLMPAFFGGLMLACQAYRESKPVTFEFLFAGFKDKFGSLALLGLIWMIGVFVVSMIAGVFCGGCVWWRYCDRCSIW